MAWKGPIHCAKAALGIALVVAAVPFALVATLFSRPKQRTAADVAKFLGDFAEETGDDYDWDDLTSIPIADPALEALRQEAEMIQLPITPEGRKTLASLRARAEAMRR